MNLKALLAISLVCCFTSISAQKVTHSYKIDELRNRLNKSDSLLVVNFWATWCKPCVQELPAFDSLALANPKVKVLLVCLDFKEELTKKVNPFLKKHHIKVECVLLDEVNGNDFVNKISPTWSGAIPATLIKKNKSEQFFEKKLTLNELKLILDSIH
jgi:thiol-disulfide isomerase/thioredoxin